MKAWQWAGLAIALAVLASLPWWGSDVMVQFGINALLLAVLAQGWNIIGGYTGYASFGNSVFYGLGSYGVAIAMVQWHLPFGVGLVFAFFSAWLCIRWLLRFIATHSFNGFAWYRIVFGSFILVSAHFGWVHWAA